MENKSKETCIPLVFFGAFQRGIDDIVKTEDEGIVVVLTLTLWYGYHWYIRGVSERDRPYCQHGR